MLHGLEIRPREGTVDSCLAGCFLCHSRTTVAAAAVHRVCFFVLRNGHWCNRVPGAHLRIACLPSALTLTLPVLCQA